MTDLEIIKTLTGETDEDLVNILLQVSEEKILAHTGRTRMISELSSARREWAIVAYNRLGMQGETSRSEAGITSAFAEIPKDIQDVINRYRLARCGGHAYEKKPAEDVSP